MSASAPSSTPSSPAFHFPGILPKKEQPNAHPYAIHTSSTAILSRSNSTSAHASVGPHHYIPMSPSPTSPQHSPTKVHRPSRHRYSRSLTSDQPPPLPPPPGAVSNQKDDSNTPRKQGHRADTLPSSAGPPLQNLDLPGDPKSWTPSQLSSYLFATLRTGDSNLPPPVAKDIAIFVNERRITGKTFLRLSEDDLLQFEIDQLWRSTLLTVSRGLRQTVLRDRIWGSGHTPPNEEDKLGNDANGSKAPRARSRHSSLANDQGRVKDLVHSLEQSSPTRAGSAAYRYDASDDSDNGGFSAKSAKRMSASNELFSSNHHHHYHHHHSSTPSPSKNNRSLPPRGSVNDLFNPPSVESDTAVQEKEDDTTIKYVAKRNMNGREPRMLPFPPSQAPVISPMPTGSHFPLPLSPEHTGNAYGHLYPADYEIGFRSHTRSPYSQVFVVRHNPSSPSNSLRADEANSKRLLPFPPVTGETHLHHPKPRRLVGNIDDPSVTDAGSLDVREHETNGATGSTTSGTEGYETAIETQNESEGLAPDVTINDGDEEPTVQELVASDPTSKPISGVEAWELDLGETVKRIGGDVDSPDPKGEGSMAEIGRKVGKHPTAPRGARGIADGSKRGHIQALFDPPPRNDAKSSDEMSRSPEMADLEENGTEELENSREQHLFEIEQSIAESERVISERETAVSRKEQDIAEREHAIQRRELEVERREGVVRDQERSLSDQQVLDAEQWAEKHKELQEQARVGDVDRQRLEAKQQTLEERILGREAEMISWEKRMETMEEELRLWGKRFETMEEELNKKMNATTLAASESTWPTPVDILRKCWRMLGMSDDITTADSTVSVPHQTNPRTIRRDILFGPSRSGGYLVLMSIGVCVVALRVLDKIRRR